MSLMNDALRKKSRETTGSPVVKGFIDVSDRPRISRRWLVVLAGLILLTIAVLYGTHLLQSSTGNALLVMTPQPGRSLPPANHPIETTSEVQLRSDGEARPASVNRQAETPVSEDSPADNRLATAVPVAVPPSATVDGDMPDPRPGVAAAAPQPTDGKPAVPPAAETALQVDAAVESSRREPNILSRAFEPGPVKTDQGEKHRPVEFRRSRAPAPPVASPKIGQASGTMGKLNTHAAVHKNSRANVEDDLFYKKARAYHRNGRLAEATRLYRQVLKTHANHPGTMLNLAAAYMQQGKYTEAAPLLERLEGSNPRPQGVLLNLAMAAIGMGAAEKALDYLDRAAALSDATPWEIRFHRAVAFARMNRLPEALELYREAETERPDDPGLQFNLAVTCDALGFYPQAVTHYEAALRFPSGPSATDKETITRRIQILRRYLDTAQSTATGQ
ncbi:tetratricopeptide repeat protein [Desulfosarcina sp.]|uniref:tetratricopeptide repeat protein n=1 Tax=Desulfosarcina sp. TaxID=2027861 RepID=UPI0035684409